MAIIPTLKYLSSSSRFKNSNNLIDTRFENGNYLIHWCSIDQFVMPNWSYPYRGLPCGGCCYDSTISHAGWSDLSTNLSVGKIIQQILNFQRITNYTHRLGLFTQTAMKCRPDPFLTPLPTKKTNNCHSPTHQTNHCLAKEDGAQGGGQFFPLS